MYVCTHSLYRCLELVPLYWGRLPRSFARASVILLENSSSIRPLKLQRDGAVVKSIGFPRSFSFVVGIFSPTAVFVSAVIVVVIIMRLLFFFYLEGNSENDKHNAFTENRVDHFEYYAIFYIHFSFVIIITIFIFFFFCNLLLSSTFKAFGFAYSSVMIALSSGSDGNLTLKLTKLNIYFNLTC